MEAVSYHALFLRCECVACLCKRQRVDYILAGNLETDVAASLGVPRSLGTSLDLGVDLVVVRGGKDREVVGGGDGGAVRLGGVAHGGRVAGHLRLVDVVAGARASEEALMADDGVNVCGGALEEVEKGAAVEVALLEVQVALGTLALSGGREIEETLELEALCERVRDLDLGLERVGRVPGLGQSKACGDRQMLIN